MIYSKHIEGSIPVFIKFLKHVWWYDYTLMFFIIADMMMYAGEYDMEFILFFIGIIQKCSKIFPLVYILPWTYVLLGDSKKKGNGCRSDRLLA